MLYSLRSMAHNSVGRAAQAGGREVIVPWPFWVKTITPRSPTHPCPTSCRDCQFFIARRMLF